MREGLSRGADMINDVRALQRPGALDIVAQTDVPVVLMHMQGDPQTMQQAPSYRNVVAEVGDFLSQRVLDCEAAGISRRRIVLDPGFGFGKTLAHNIELFKRIPALRERWGFDVLVGVSRKRMIGDITGRPVDQRITGSAVAAALAARAGAKIIRVHDVAETVDAIKVMEALDS